MGSENGNRPNRKARGALGVRVDNLWVKSRALTGPTAVARACIPRQNRAIADVPDRHMPKALFQRDLR